MYKIQWRHMKNMIQSQCWCSCTGISPWESTWAREDLQEEAQLTHRAERYARTAQGLEPEAQLTWHSRCFAVSKLYVYSVRVPMSVTSSQERNSNTQSLHWFRPILPLESTAVRVAQAPSSCGRIAFQICPLREAIWHVDSVLLENARQTCWSEAYKNLKTTALRRSFT